MADNILILGNGFDIAMGRKTRYEDFITFTKYIYNEQDEQLQSFLAEKSIKFEKYKENVYLKFINDNKEQLGENWSNIEMMISNIAEAVLFISDNNQEYFNTLFYKETPIQEQYILKHENNALAIIFVIRAFKKWYVEKGWGRLQKELSIKCLNDEFIIHLEELTEFLEIYLSYQNYLDFEINKLERKETALDAICNISEANVINFNYTNTAEKLFEISEKQTHFIHGRVDIERQYSNINTMVFGIEDKEDNINTGLIPYQKYYQRVVKETGSLFEEFFSPNIEFSEDDKLSFHSHPKNIIVFWHSIDPLDKEIFQKCFDLAERGNYESRFIFTYYDENTKRSLIRNLAIILGKDKLVGLTGEQKVIFVQSEDPDKMRRMLLL